MSGWSLREWWQSLWRRDDRPGGTSAGPSTAPRPTRSAPGFDDRDEPRRKPPSLPRYSPPPADHDPQREAHLGAVLEALGRGALSRAELGTRVGAAEWGPGRLDAVVAHGLASGVLVESDDGLVRARYTD